MSALVDMREREMRYSDTDSDASVASPPPPRPIYMGSSGQKRSKGSKGRSGKRPPTLERQIAASTSPSSSHKRKKTSRSKNCDRPDELVRVKTRVSPPVSDNKEHEVITLSDDEEEDMPGEEDRLPPPTLSQESMTVISDSSSSCDESVRDESDQYCVEIRDPSPPPLPPPSRKQRKNSPSKAIVLAAKKKSQREKAERSKAKSSKSKKSNRRESSVEEQPITESRPHKSGSTKKRSGGKNKHRRSVTPITTSDRDSSRSPSRASPAPPTSRQSRQDAFFVLQQRPVSRSSSTFSFTSGEVVAVFDKRYASRNTERFWMESPSPSPARPASSTADEEAAKQRTSESSRVLTKASLKEIPSTFHQLASSAFVGHAGGGASTKTMLSVLAETNKKGKPGRKKRGRRKGSTEEWGGGKGRKSHLAGISPVSSCHSSKSPFSPRSNPCSEGGGGGQQHRYSDLIDCSEGYKKSGGGGKKKSKKDKTNWKSKHKNVIDPIFLGRVEHLIQDMSSCQLEKAISRDYWPDRPHDSVPSIFKKRKILGSKKKSERGGGRRGKRSSVHASDNGVSASDGSMAAPAKAPSVDATTPSTPTAEAAEQRLPLKKRHHHHQLSKPGETGGGGGGIDSESGHSSSSCALSPPLLAHPRGRRAPVDAPSKAMPSHAIEKGKRAAAAAKSSSEANDELCIIHENFSGKKQQPTAADRIVEKLGIQNLVRRNSRSGSTEGNASKPGRKKQQQQPASGTANNLDSIAACIDKYTSSNVPKSLTTPLSIETAETALSQPSKPSKAKAVTPRKRHLMQMMQQKDKSTPPEEAPSPPTLDKAPSPAASSATLLTASTTRPQNTSPAAAVPAVPPSTAVASGASAKRAGVSPIVNSPPRLSPQHCSSGGGQTTRNLPSAPDTTSHRSTNHFDEDEEIPNGPSNWGGGRLPGAKYSDISSDESSTDSLKLRPPKVRSPPQDLDAAFTRLQQSVTRKESSGANTEQSRQVSLPYVSSDEDLAPRTESRQQREEQEAVAPVKKKRGRKPKKKMQDNDPNHHQEKAAEHAAPEDEPAVPKQRTRKRSQKQREADEDAAACAMATAPKPKPGRKPLREKDPQQLQSPTPTDVEADMEQLVVKPMLVTDQAERDRLVLPKCSVRVHKLTEQDILESSPSPPSLHSASPRSCAGSDIMPDLSNSIAVPRHEQIIEPSPPAVEVPEADAASSLVVSQDEGAEVVVPAILKKRKRRSNRTGFPSNKKKKRSQSCESPSGLPTTPGRGRPPGRKPKPAVAQVPVRTSSRIIALDEEKKAEAEKDASSAGTDILSQAISQIQQVAGEKRKKSVDSEPEKMKRPRGRPPKKKPPPQVTLPPPPPVVATVVSSSEESLSRDGSVSNDAPVSRLLPSKRSRLYDDVDDDMDCLSLLPPLSNCESGLSSETPSGAETEDNSRSSSCNRQKKKKKNFKKSSLKAGLFADCFKETEEEKGSNGNNNGALERKNPVYVKEDHPHGLLPPPYYCGRQLRQKKEDFQLPFDLWWMQAHKQLPGRDVAATWNYKKIKNNVCFDVKPLAQFESQTCQCARPADPQTPGCGEDCINRMTYAECDPKLCQLGDRCSNNAIQKHRVVTGLERFMTEKKGWGIKTRIGIPSGQFITEYVGEVVSERVFKHRMVTEYAGDTHHYCLHLDGGMVIDGHRIGGECRFVNHSCEPNCEIQKWTVNGFYRMALFSLKEIAPGEELTYDYNFSLFNPHEGQACQCGSANCRGVIGGRTQRVNGIDVDGVGGSGGDRGGDPKKKNKVAKVRRTDGGMPVAPMLAPMKPMSKQQELFVRHHRCFMMRNWEKVRRVRESVQRKVTGQMVDKDELAGAVTRPEDMILTRLTALTTARSMQTRRLAIAQDDPNVTKVIKLAQVLREIFAQITTVDGKSLKIFELVRSLQCHGLFQTTLVGRSPDSSTRCLPRKSIPSTTLTSTSRSTSTPSTETSSPGTTPLPNSLTATSFGCARTRCASTAASRRRDRPPSSSETSTTPSSRSTTRSWPRSSARAGLSVSARSSASQRPRPRRR